MSYFVGQSVVKKLLGLLPLMLISASILGQKVGSWNDCFSYFGIIDVCEGEENEIIAAAKNGIFIYNTQDQQIERLNKVNQLSDVGISTLYFSKTRKELLVGYSNGNFDIVNKTGTTNISDIMRSSIIGNKKIFHVEVQDNIAYLATGLGVVTIDLDRKEVKSTYILGDLGSVTPISRVLLKDSLIFAVGTEQILKASLNDPFLADYQRWESISNLPDSGTIADFIIFQGDYFLNRRKAAKDDLWKWSHTSNTWEIWQNLNDGTRCQKMWTNENVLTLPLNNRYQVFNGDLQLTTDEVQANWVWISAQKVIVDPSNTQWIANDQFGLQYKTTQGTENLILPDGPRSDAMRKVNAYNDQVWIATGNVAPWWGNTWNIGYQTALLGDTWINDPMGDGGNEYGPAVFDVLDVAVDPTNTDHVLFSSWEDGVIERNPGATLTYYNAQTNNCPLEEGPFDWAPGWTGVSGLCFDLKGNAWISNSYSNFPLHVMDADKNFTSYTFQPFISNSDIIDQVIHTQENYVFAIVRNKGILALDYKNTPGNLTDDSFKILKDKEGEGGLPTKDIYCMIEDLEGAIWVGSLRGLSIFYNQADIFSEAGADAEQILITQDGNVQILLETEAINSIEIDGGNRKWIATQNNGVFLFSADGLEQLAHYTKENSPLPSNNVYDIGLNQANGTVYFATDAGMVSLVSSATNFDNEISKVYAFPNPVSSDYEGLITIQGLAYESEVMITDPLGNLVFKADSEGGRVVWNGRVNNGEKPSWGIYSVLVTNADGSVDNTTKIAFVK
jgi:hypothetical protein